MSWFAVCAFPSPSDVKLFHMEIKPPFGEFCALVKEDLGRNHLVVFGSRVWSGLQRCQRFPAPVLGLSWIPAWLRSVSEHRKKGGTEEEKLPALLKS